MKKILLFIAVVALTCTTAQAQEVRLGAKLGLNVASLGGDSYGVGSLGSRTSFHIGALAEIPLKGKFALQPELLYSSEGSNWSAWGLGNSDLKLDYLRVPVLAKFYIIEGLSAEAGPVFGVLVNASDDSDEDIKDAFKSFDAAFGIGATYRLNMGVFFSLRYNKGLLDVNDIDDYSGSNQSNVFQVSAGYSF
ncbi:porin family protein [Aequorivita sp. KMM 9714]|uniref:porin family protein n=1 Tax=Aequorivita sp. KMM 9714 TaxID=2707173 RepID=UPI0013EA94E3|nr:porin family protein [Aequorivita sp. KMM 9714]NGX84167.1 PorT family protein [Aequorivita sp. KMM 9714]